MYFSPKSNNWKPSPCAQPFSQSYLKAFQNRRNDTGHYRDFTRRHRVLRSNKMLTKKGLAGKGMESSVILYFQLTKWQSFILFFFPVSFCLFANALFCHSFVDDFWKKPWAIAIIFYITSPNFIKKTLIHFEEKKNQISMRFTIKFWLRINFRLVSQRFWAFTMDFLKYNFLWHKKTIYILRSKSPRSSEIHTLYTWFSKWY